MAQLVGALACNQRIAGLIPSQDACLGCRFILVWAHIPGLGMYGRQPTDASLLHQCFSSSLALSLPLSLKTMKKCPRVRITKMLYYHTVPSLYSNFPIAPKMSICSWFIQISTVSVKFELLSLPRAHVFPMPLAYRRDQVSCPVQCPTFCHLASHGFT